MSIFEENCSERQVGDLTVVIVEGGRERKEMGHDGVVKLLLSRLHLLTWKP